MEGSSQVTSHIPFFFFCVNTPMCLLSHALVILVTYRDKGLPQLPKPSDFIERKKRWAPDEPVNTFRLPRSETKADAITKKKKRGKEITNYLGTCMVNQNHVGRAGERNGDYGFLNKNLVDLEQGGPR